MQPEDYNIGWVCAVETEFVAALQLLDEKHEQVKIALKNDNNAYRFGRIGDHNVVIACLSKGKYGIASAATVAATESNNWFVRLRMNFVFPSSKSMNVCGKNLPTIHWIN